MADGKIRIDVELNAKKAEQGAKKLSEAFEETKTTMENSVELDIDLNQAEKELKQVEKELEKFKKKRDELQKGKYGEYEKQYAELEEGYKSDVATASKVNDPKSQQSQIQNIETMMNYSVDQLNQKYSKTLQEMDEYDAKLQSCKNRQQELSQAIEQAKQAQAQENALTEKASENFNKTKEAANKTKNEIEQTTRETRKGSKETQKEANEKKKSRNETKKDTSEKRKGRKETQKTTGETKKQEKSTKRTSKHLSDFNKKMRKFSSLMKGSLKPADNLRKKFTKIGLALLGARSIFVAFKQVISEAMSNNEKLQNQLTAAKGVIGEALAPAISLMVNLLSQAVTFADMIYQTFTGTSLIAKYNAKQAQKQADATQDAADAAEEYQKQLAGFDVANKLGDSSSSSSSTSSGSTSSSENPMFETASLDSWMNSIIDKFKAGDWGAVGKTIADSINSALDNINWNGIQSKVKAYCKDLGEAVDGFVNGLDWNKVGNNVGQAINTVTTGINTLVDSINWESLGAGFADGLNGLVNSVDTNELGKTLSAKIKVITDTLYGFFNGDEKKGTEGFDFKNFGSKIASTVNSWFANIEWGKIASNLSSSISGAFKTITGFIKDLDTDAIIDDIVEFVQGIDWVEIATSASEALGAAIGKVFNIALKLGELFNDAFKNIASYFDDSIDEAGGDVVEGIFNGIANWLIDVGEWIRENVLSPFIDGFKEAFDIHSPSKNPDIINLGKNLIEGVFNGIKEWISDVKTWFQENVFSKITEAWDELGELTVNFNANATAKFEELRKKWQDLGKKGKSLVASFKAKKTAFFEKVRKQWQDLGKKGKTLVANFKAKKTAFFDKVRTQYNNLRNKSAELVAKAKQSEAFKNMKKKWDSVKSKAATVTASLKDNITSGIRNILTSLCNMINKVIGVLNKLPGINISTISPPKLARGGIVNVPGRGVVARVGEAGAEAVLPLENNTGWMDLLAERLANKINAGGGVIQTIITLDGETIAKKITKVNGRRNIRMNGGVI